MTKLEKVIKGLECCALEKCPGKECPYVPSTCEDDCVTVLCADALELLKEQQPTVDAVPVKHGQWLEDEKTYLGPDLSNYVCSSCKRVGGTWIKGLKPENLFTYCPWCGAKMDGERKESDA